MADVRESDGAKELLSLHERREALEARADALHSKLTQSGWPGLDGPLVDAEGFPVFGFDEVAAIRSTRREYRETVYDIQEANKTIERLLVQVFAAEDGAASHTPIAAGSTSASASASTAKEEKFTTLPPFCEIDEVRAGSPADEAGLRVGDRVAVFGSTHCGNHAALSGLVGEVRAAVDHGSSLEVEVLRGASRALLHVRPRPWAGAGVLGCHFLPL